MRVSDSPIIVWFQLDLRLSDHPALDEAVRRGGPVIPVFVWSPEDESPWAPGAASRWWLHQSLASLERDLEAAGSRLVLRRGAAAGAALLQLARECGAGAVFWHRRYEPGAARRDAQIEAALGKCGIEARQFSSSALLFEPDALQTASGSPYKVFTPFSRACLRLADSIADPLSPPARLAPPSEWPKSVALADLELEPKINWAEGLRGAWTPGEAGAARRLERFLEEAMENYADGRDQPGIEGVSRLSPYLHFGEISPRQVWRAVNEARFSLARAGKSSRERSSGVRAGAASGEFAKGADAFLRQLLWREFAYHLLYHFPHTPAEPLRPEFARFPWREITKKEKDRRDIKDRKDATNRRGFISADGDGGAIDTDSAAQFLRAWQRGATGFPIVDAGMRQLWTTGWMHNRVRMIVASFLVKDLLISWQTGARWFWDTLVDADLANNTFGWQWTAGCGADAAPFFRVFNPAAQGRKFDPDGAYVRAWVPELSRLPSRCIHAPWEASPAELRAAGVRLGENHGDEQGNNYPLPIVDHASARLRALDALARMKEHNR